MCIVLRVKLMSSVTEEQLHAVGAGWYSQSKRGGDLDLGCAKLCQCILTTGNGLNEKD